VFHHLTKEHIRQIVDLQLRPVKSQLIERGMTLEITEAAKDLLSEKGYDEAFGARPLQRVIQTMVEDQLSEALLRGEYQIGDTIRLDREGDEIKLRSTTLAKSSS
jgi:ATP-dependent Clp protease ATP-binding subunit ClpC